MEESSRASVGTSDTPTRELVARYLAGDGAAERALFDEAREFLVAEALAHAWMSGAQAWTTPEDVADETLLRAISSGQLGRFELQRPGSLRAWLRTILERVLADQYRRHSARKRGGAEVVRSVDELRDVAGRDAEPAATDTTPSSRVRHAELCAMARAVLEPREWEAWHLVHDEDWATGAVAMRLRTTEGAVRAMCARARVKLVKAIQASRARER